LRGFSEYVSANFLTAGYAPPQAAAMMSSASWSDWQSEQGILTDEEFLQQKAKILACAL
jgi:hypothetical protein